MKYYYIWKEVYMQKTKINLIAGIFGILASVGLILIIVGAISAGTSAASQDAHHDKSINAATATGIGSVVIGYIVFAVGGIGAFVSGIIQLTKTEGHPSKGLMIAAGILNILGGVFFLGTIFSFICHFKQGK